jgi:hypothetical protein
VATVINIAAIQGVTAPVIGGSPVAAITENAQYMGDILWSPAVSGAFAPSTQYTATISLMAKTGYTLQGVAANFFTVVGAYTAYVPSEGVVTAVFPATAALGSIGPGGGKLFYYSAAGFTMADNNQVCHYLEAAPSNMPRRIWVSTSTAGGVSTGTGIGAGRKNTALILAVDTEAPAAKACNEYSNGGYTDWFLPSRDELNVLYTNRTTMGNMWITNRYYWSSSQGNYVDAWLQDFSYGGQGEEQKFNYGYVRAVRAF